MLEDYSSHFVVCLSVCLSVADLEDGGLLALQRDMNLKSEKTVLFEGTLEYTHSFTNGKVPSHNTRFV